MPPPLVRQLALVWAPRLQALPPLLQGGGGGREIGREGGREGGNGGRQRGREWRDRGREGR